MNDQTGPVEMILEQESLARILAGVIQDNRRQVIGWKAGEPGCWGYLAGKAITACRGHLGRSLSDQERRLVWHQLWTSLEQSPTPLSNRPPKE